MDRGAPLSLLTVIILGVDSPSQDLIVPDNKVRIRMFPRHLYWALGATSLAFRSFAMLVRTRCDAQIQSISGGGKQSAAFKVCTLIMPNEQIH